MSALENHRNVIAAVILRDMRTRFGRSHLSYVLAISWPLVHLLAIVTLVSYTSKVSPLGTDMSVFVASGVIPYVLCLYPARMIGYAVEVNKPLFLFPVVKTFDVIASRVIIEFLTAFTVLILFIIIMSVFERNIIPIDTYTWFYSVFLIIYLSISMGVLNSIISSIFRFWHIVFVLSMLFMYFTSGVFFPVRRFSQEIQDVVWYNPLLHCVELLRMSYFEGYNDDIASRMYLASFATVCLFLGLMGEQFLRGKLLSS